MRRSIRWSVLLGLSLSLIALLAGNSQPAEAATPESSSRPATQFASTAESQPAEQADDQPASRPASAGVEFAEPEDLSDLPSSYVAPPSEQKAADEPPGRAAASADPPPNAKVRDALTAYRAKDYLAARGPLTEALLTADLSFADERSALEALDDIAARTLLSTGADAGDHYADLVEIRPGDTLTKIARREKLSYDSDWLGELNGIADPRGLKVGRKIKVLRGAVDAFVSKGGFTLDLVIRLPGRQPAFLKRLPIGVGRNDGTPQGLWRVKAKATAAAWTPPPSAGMPARTIKCGQPGYPLGREGRWISLEGADANTRGLAGYGLHGTDEPDSIGKAASLGCIRLRDDDIRLVYRLLAPGESTVEIRP